MPIYKSLLPAEYQEVEYIESTGTQYIDTNYNANVNTKTICNVMYDSVAVATQVFGTQNSASIRYGVGFDGNGYQTKFDGTQLNSAGSPTTNTKYKIELSKNGFYENDVLLGSVATNSFTTTVPLLLFALNNDGSVLFYGSLKLYSCQIYDNGTLVRNFVPCYRKSDSVIGLFDTVNKVFYTNQGTGDFLKGNDVKPRQVKSLYKGSTKIIKRYKGTDVIYRGLPSAYQEVEYIESSGTQYIDSGVNPDANTNIDIGYLRTNTQTTSLFGCQDHDNAYAIAGNNNTEYIRFFRQTGEGKDYTYKNNLSYARITASISQMTLFEINNVGATSTTTISISTTETTNISYPIYLFARNNAGSVSGNCAMKLWHFKIYSSSTLVRNFIPCFRNSDNEIGLYDLVNGVFYTNAGTGTFVKGGNV